jgi:hypothetical protein
VLARHATGHTAAFAPLGSTHRRSPGCCRGGVKYARLNNAPGALIGSVSCSSLQRMMLQVGRSHNFTARRSALRGSAAFTRESCSSVYVHYASKRNDRSALVEIGLPRQVCFAVQRGRHSSISAVRGAACQLSRILHAVLDLRSTERRSSALGRESGA